MSNELQALTGEVKEAAALLVNTSADYIQMRAAIATTVLFLAASALVYVIVRMAKSSDKEKDGSDIVIGMALSLITLIMVACVLSNIPRVINPRGYVATQLVERIAR